MIYIVTSGEYSEYSIRGVFTDRDEAEKFLKYYNCDEVEEFELNPSTPDTDLFLYGCNYQVSGETSQVYRTSNYGEWSDEATMGVYTAYRSPTAYHFHALVEARDQAHAEKIWQDKVRAILAGSLFVLYIASRQVLVGRGEPSDTVLPVSGSQFRTDYFRQTCRFDGDGYTVLSEEKR